MGIKFGDETTKRRPQVYMMGQPAPVGPGYGARHTLLFLGDSGSVLEGPRRRCYVCGTLIYDGGECPNCEKFW